MSHGSLALQFRITLQIRGSCFIHSADIVFKQCFLTLSSVQSFWLQNTDCYWLKTSGTARSIVCAGNGTVRTRCLQRQQFHAASKLANIDKNTAAV